MWVLKALLFCIPLLQVVYGQEAVVDGNCEDSVAAIQEETGNCCKCLEESGPKGNLQCFEPSPEWCSDADEDGIISCDECDWDLTSDSNMEEQGEGEGKDKKKKKKGKGKKKGGKGKKGNKEGKGKKKGKNGKKGKKGKKCMAEEDELMEEGTDGDVNVDGNGNVLP